MRSACSLYRSISIHALREEGDGKCIGEKCMAYEFLSTPSARRATLKQQEVSYAVQHFYPRPPRGGRPHSGKSFPAAESFLSTPSARRATLFIFVWTKNILKFLSTPSARRATLFNSGIPFRLRYFYPRPPRGGRHPWSGLSYGLHHISIHALREEGDRDWAAPRRN